MAYCSGTGAPYLAGIVEPCRSGTEVAFRSGMEVAMRRFSLAHTTMPSFIVAASSDTTSYIVIDAAASKDHVR